MLASRSIARAAVALSLAVPLAAQSPAASDTTTIVAGPRAAGADSALRALVPQGFSGVVLVASKGEIILRNGYGLAERERKTPFAPATVVQIGSNTKDFTAVAILQLQEKGKLSVHDSLATFFPNAPADKRGITIAQLLAHRSGLEPNLPGGDFRPLSRDEFLAAAFASKLIYAPGQGQHYSNLGFSVLAAIIEVLTGDSYGTYCQKNIWNPVGLQWTGLLLPHYDTLLLAHGYEGAADQGTMLDRPHADNGPYWNLRGNGGFLSTVSEMYRFYDALFNTTLLLQPRERDERFPPNQPIILAGSDMINFFLYNREPQAGVVIIVATNSSGFAAPRARDAIAAVMGLPTPNGRRVGMGGGAGRGAGAKSAVAAVAFPDTPAARRMQEYLRLFNAGDSAAAVPFIRDSMVQGPDDKRTPEQRAGQMRAIRQRLGALTPLAIASSSPAQFVLTVRPEQEESATLSVDVEPAAPFRIVQLRIAVE
jgi:CubicO group peptidase (beta-lactamase class C family)